MSKIFAAFGTMLTVAIISAVLTIWCARQAAFHLERTELAHQQYQGFLSLSNHTYQLFKQFGDALLIGDRDRGVGESQLAHLIRADIDRIRQITAREIELVGEEEFEELELLEEVETQIELLLGEYASAIEASADLSPADYWARLARILDQQVDRDFNRLIRIAIEEEAGEVAEVRAETTSLIRLYQVLAVVFAVIAVAAAGITLHSLVQDIRRPIARVLIGAKDFSMGYFQNRIEASGAPEILEIATALNRMADGIAQRESALAATNVRLERAVADRTAELESLLGTLRRSEANRRRLLADVSHELRTPLTVIRGEADIALRGSEKTLQEYREALARTRDAAVHTGRLVDDLLFVARQESGEVRLRKSRLDLVKLLRQVTDASHALAAHLSVALRFETDLREATAQADAERIRQVVAILLDNAMRYGSREVVLGLRTSPDGFVIWVQDDGPGMSEEEQAWVFERFYRGSNAAEKYADGAGLGLPVAKSIVEAHDGVITIDSRPGQGTTFAVTLPQRPRLEAVA